MKLKMRTTLPPINSSTSRYDTEPNKPIDLNKKYFSGWLQSFKYNPQKQKELQNDSASKKNEEEDKEEWLNNEKLLAKIYKKNYFIEFSRMKTDILNTIEVNKKGKGEIIEESYEQEKTGFGQFEKTNYSCATSMRDFYKKYQKYKVLNRKEPIKNVTPSFAFIQHTEREKIVPNPLGLIKREGDIRHWEMNAQRVGDTYIKVLSKSIECSKNLNTIQLNTNRISSLGAGCLFNAINSNKILMYKIITLDLSGNEIGAEGIEEMLKYVGHKDCKLENLNIANNLLGDTSIMKWCESISGSNASWINYLNYSKNNITDASIPIITDMLMLCSNLQVFIINNNNIKNPGASLWINKLRGHGELRILDIAWNIIGNDLVEPPLFEEIVNYNIKDLNRTFGKFIYEDFLKTCKFSFKDNPWIPNEDKNQNKGGAKKGKGETPQKETIVFKPIKVNPRPISNFAKELGLYFHELGTSWVHLDLSHNNLSNSDCVFIAQEIKENHTILGIHCDGNEMEIDGLGFITPLKRFHKKRNYFANSQISYELGENAKISKTNIDSVRPIRHKNNCWICEGWREVEFEFIPKERIWDANSHWVKIHLNFDNYKPFDMYYTGSKYQIVRMCPPGKIEYFFTWDTVPVTEFSSSDSNTRHTLPKGSEISFTFDREYMDELNNIRSRLEFEMKNTNTSVEEEGKSYVNEDKDLNLLEGTINTLNSTANSKGKNSRITIKIYELAKKIVKMNPNVVNEEYRKTTKFTEPRPLKIIDRFIKPRTPWSFPISIWAYFDYNYEGDTEDYLKKCFKHDFERCEFVSDLKNEPDRVNELSDFLWPKYRDIIDCYKYYSSVLNLNVWQITQNVLTEFVAKCVGWCDQNYGINNVFLTQKAVVNNPNDWRDRKKKNPNLNENNLVRHQFMNLLVKVSKDKYIGQLKVTKDLMEAVRKSFTEHYDPAIVGFEYHKWRKERYYNEQVDNFLKAHLPLLDAIYHSWAPQQGPRKQDVWMKLEHYNDFILHWDFVDINEYPIRENPLFFNYSIKLQINEIETDKHVRMWFPEFLEAFCRAIDKANPIPPNESPSDWPKERKENQPWINKLENSVGYFRKMINHPDYKTWKEKFPMPSKDFTTGLYVFSNDSPFYQGFIIKPGRNDIRRKTHAPNDTMRVESNY